MRLWWQKEKNLPSGKKIKKIGNFLLFLLSEWLSGHEFVGEQIRILLLYVCFLWFVCGDVGFSNVCAEAFKFAPVIIPHSDRSFF